MNNSISTGTWANNATRERKGPIWTIFGVLALVVASSTLFLNFQVYGTDKAELIRSLFIK